MGLPRKRAAIVTSLLPVSIWAAGISYSVNFQGLDDLETLRSVRSSSQLLSLRKKPPASINALRFRAESDVPQLVQVLRSHGYLEAEVQVRIEKEMRDYRVVVAINPGPQYQIEQYRLEFNTPSPKQTPSIQPSELGIDRGSPADTKKILDSELCALHILSQHGFPLATIENREITADGKTKRVQVVVTIDTGPLSHFGQTQIEGNCSVQDALIEQQIRWQSGELYDSCLVEESQACLMDTGLFSSVYITHPKSLDAAGYLPMKVEVAETKHKSVSLGASYQTTYGPGATLGWENRNVGGLGRRMTFQADIAQRVHTGIATYQIPHFCAVGQTYTIQAQASHESITPYRMQSYTLLNRFDRVVNPCFYFSVGPKLEYLKVRSSVDNGNFFLIEGPVYLRATNVEDFLNPASGIRFDYRATPAINVADSTEVYFSQLFMLSGYLPLWEERLILAQKLTLGTILSRGLQAIPVPKRFFGGSDDNLRGYKYYTVSPLDEENKPIGGRSAIYYSLEPRLRLSDSFGLVPFLDVGNVYLDALPNFGGKWRKSAGIGLRYYSFVGPLRLDVAFPLDRREGIDPHWWIFVSLGQTF